MATGIVLTLLGVWIFLRTVAGPSGRKLPDIIVGWAG